MSEFLTGRKFLCALTRRLGNCAAEGTNQARAATPTRVSRLRKALNTCKYHTWKLCLLPVVNIQVCLMLASVSRLCKPFNTCSCHTWKLRVVNVSRCIFCLEQHARFLVSRLCRRIVRAADNCDRQCAYPFKFEYCDVCSQEVSWGFERFCRFSRSFVGSRELPKVLGKFRKFSGGFVCSREVS